MRIAILVLLTAVLFACKNDPVVETKPVSMMSAEEIQEKTSDIKAYVLPSACDLATIEMIADIFGAKATDVEVKDGNPSGTDARSCFFKWDDGTGVSGSGILLQVSKNPVPDDFPDWPEKYIDSKITNGEALQSGDLIQYQELSGVGVAGAYNHELAKYYWRGSNDIIYMIAMNLEISESKALKAVKKLGKTMISNLESK